MVIPWNKGLNRSDPRIRKYCEKGVETRLRKGSYKANSGTFKKGQTRAHFPKGRKNPRLSEVRKKMFKEETLNHSGKKNPFFGKKLNENQSKALKIGQGREGEKCNFWKGGITAIQDLIRGSEKYRKWREKIFERDNWACGDCHKRSKAKASILLEAHHKKEFSVIIKENNIKSLEDAERCGELWDLDNGVTLCRECHRKTDNYGRKKDSR